MMTPTAPMRISGGRSTWGGSSRGRPRRLLGLPLGLLIIGLEHHPCRLGEFIAGTGLAPADRPLPVRLDEAVAARSPLYTTC